MLEEEIEKCRTRWVEQITGLDDVEDIYVSIAFCLKSMSVNEGRVYKRETSTKASSFYKLITSFDFTATLVLTKSILDLTLPVTELLQGKEINLFNDASQLLDSLKSVLFQNEILKINVIITATGLFLKWQTR